MTDLRLLGRSDILSAARVLARSFEDYHVFKYYYPEKMQRDKVVRLFMEYSLYEGVRYGETYATSGMEGIAVWTAHYPLSAWQSLRSVPFAVLLSFARNGGGRMQPYARYLSSLHRRIVPSAHLYLAGIGVAPEYQGKGYAGQLVRPMLARCDHEGRACYLETSEEKNMRIYRHLGFEIVDESLIPGSPLMNWAMLRRPAL